MGMSDSWFGAMKKQADYSKTDVDWTQWPFRAGSVEKMQKVFNLSDEELETLHIEYILSSYGSILAKNSRKSAERIVKHTLKIMGSNTSS